MFASSIATSSTSAAAAALVRRSAVQATTVSSRSPAFFRTYATPSRVASSPTAAESSKKGGEAAASAHIPSSCPAGTPLSGLSIYKDGPEVVAKPDEEYPSWLWDLAAEPSMKTTFASTNAAEVVEAGSASGAAFSKGAMRAKDKREMKAKRAAQAVAEREKAKAARIANKAKGADAKTPELEAAAKVERDPLEVEREQKKLLRKANRERIKTNNFIRSS